MRFCSFCTGRHVFYVTFSQFDYYEQYLYYNRYYELVSSSVSEVARFYEKDRRFFKGVLAVEIKAFRLYRQRQLIRDRLRVLGNYKMRNIIKLKINEMIAEDIRVILI